MSYTDHLARISRRNDAAMRSADRMRLDPPDDATAPECPVCKDAEASDWEPGFMSPEGWEPGHVTPCRSCMKACPRCGGEGEAKTERRGWCESCEAERKALGRKGRRKAAAGSRRAWKLRVRARRGR